jgi:predicted porin
MEYLVMKHKFKFAIIAMAMMASAGSVMADGVSVTPFVNFDAGVGSTTYNGKPGKIDQAAALGSYYSTSGFGFNGAADIGGGLKGVANVEGRFSVADGSQGDAGKIFGAASNAGLAGNFGTVTAGLHWSPYDGAWSTDSLEYNGFSAIGAAYNSKVQSDLGSSGHGSVASSILYVSPVYKNFTASAMWAPQANKTATQDAQIYSGFGLSYVSGPFNVKFATEHAPTSWVSEVRSTSNRDYTDSYIIGGSYNVGKFTFDASHKASTANGDAGSKASDEGYGLGLAYEISATDRVAFGWATDTVKADNVSDRTATSLGAQYTKQWAKGVVFYAGANLKDEINALVSKPYTTTLVAAGVRLSF